MEKVKIVTKGGLSIDVTKTNKEFAPLLSAYIETGCEDKILTLSGSVSDIFDSQWDKYLELIRLFCSRSKYGGKTLAGQFTYLTMNHVQYVICKAAKGLSFTQPKNSSEKHGSYFFTELGADIAPSPVYLHEVSEIVRVLDVHPHILACLGIQFDKLTFEDRVRHLILIFMQDIATPLKPRGDGGPWFLNPFLEILDTEDKDVYNLGIAALRIFLNNTTDLISSRITAHMAHWMFFPWNEFEAAAGSLSLNLSENMKEFVHIFTLGIPSNKCLFPKYYSYCFDGWLELYDKFCEHDPKTLGEWGLDVLETDEAEHTAHFHDSSSPLSDFVAWVHGRVLVAEYTPDSNGRTRSVTTEDNTNTSVRVENFPDSIQMLVNTLGLSACERIKDVIDKVGKKTEKLQKFRDLLGSFLEDCVAT